MKRFTLSRSAFIDLARAVRAVAPTSRQRMFASHRKEAAKATGCEVASVAAVLRGTEGDLPEAQRYALAGRLAKMTRRPS